MQNDCHNCQTVFTEDNYPMRSFSCIEIGCEYLFCQQCNVILKECPECGTQHNMCFVDKALFKQMKTRLEVEREIKKKRLLKQYDVSKITIEQLIKSKQLIINYFTEVIQKLKENINKGIYEFSIKSILTAVMIIDPSCSIVGFAKTALDIGLVAIDMYQNRGENIYNTITKAMDNHDSLLSKPYLKDFISDLQEFNDLNLNLETMQNRQKQIGKSQKENKCISGIIYFLDVYHLGLTLYQCYNLHKNQEKNIKYDNNLVGDFQLAECGRDDQLDNQIAGNQQQVQISQTNIQSFQNCIDNEGKFIKIEKKQANSIKQFKVKADQKEQKFIQLKPRTTLKKIEAKPPNQIDEIQVQTYQPEQNFNKGGITLIEAKPPKQIEEIQVQTYQQEQNFNKGGITLIEAKPPSQIDEIQVKTQQQEQNLNKGGITLIEAKPPNQIDEIQILSCNDRGLLPETQKYKMKSISNDEIIENQNRDQVETKTINAKDQNTHSDCKNDNEVFEQSKYKGINSYRIQYAVLFFMQACSYYQTYKNSKQQIEYYEDTNKMMQVSLDLFQELYDKLDKLKQDIQQEQQ